LKSRIYQGIAAFNNDPVVFAWKYKMDDVNVK